MSSSPLIARQLTTPDQAQRLEELRNGVFADVADVQECDDGYAFTFAGTDSNASALPDALLGFIDFERQCCPFLTFSLTSSPGPASISLPLAGDSSVTAFIRGSFVVPTPGSPTRPIGSLSS